MELTVFEDSEKKIDGEYYQRGEIETDNGDSIKVFVNIKEYINSK